MSYIVLARKWRPKRFKDVAGQDHITTTLLNSIRAGRIAHAYLFVGPRGIGKTTTARIFSMALTCPKSTDAEPCGNCDVCQEISQGRSIDVIEIDGASNNTVDDIRSIRENVKIAPAYLPYKVYIIDEVHMLSAAAFNAFLKTLEEPPAHVKFVLATTEAHKIPTTVLSRCQRFDFRRLTSRQIAGRLKEIVETEEIRIDEPALFAIARSTDGSMRDALSILDQLVSFSDKEIALGDVHAMLGTVGFDVYRTVASAICDGDSLLILKTIDEVVERGKDIAQFLKELTSYFRNLFMAGIDGGEGLIDLADEEIAALRELSARFQQADLIKIIRDLSELESRFRQMPSPRIALEMLLLRISRVGTEISIESVLSKLGAIEKRLGHSPKKPQTKSEPSRNEIGGDPTVAEPLVDDYNQEEPPPDIENGPFAAGGDEDEQQLRLWRELLREIREQRMSTYSFLSRGRFVGIENGEMLVAFDAQSKYNKTHLEQKEMRMLLEETLKAVANKPLKINFILEENAADQSVRKQASTEEKELIKAEEAKEARMQKVLENPVIQRTLELFQGRIVAVSDQRT